MKNPFTLSFGKKPAAFIDRSSQLDEIINDFLDDSPDSPVYILSGLRGTGKTVALDQIASTFESYPDWIVIDVNTERNILNSLAARLSNHKNSRQFFKKAKIDLSYLGLGLSVEGSIPENDIGEALNKMLQILKNQNISVLITIDEAISSKNMREFVTEFQIWQRRNFRVFLLMTGLFENIRDLQDEKNLTFLYRAPRIELEPLNLKKMAEIYKNTFSISNSEAQEMADFTKGYSYAFQILGYLCFKNQYSYAEAKADFDQYMEDRVYAKIWSELSVHDQSVLIAMANTDSNQVKTIRSQCKMEKNKFSVYRSRLLKKGILASSGYGTLSFQLPRFREFILIQERFLD